MRQDKYALNVTTGNGTGTVQGIRDMGNLWVQVSQTGGAFVCTIDVEASIDGTEFQSVLTTAVPGLFELDVRGMQLRVTISGWVSGTPVINLLADAGRSDDS